MLKTNEAEFKPVQQRHDKVLIIGGGESLIDFDWDLLKKFKGVIITVNNVVYHIPRADYWITVDPMSHGKPQRAMVDRVDGVYYFCAYPDIKKFPFDAKFYKTVNGIHYLERIFPEDYSGKLNIPKVGDYSLQEDKDKITTGNSCYGALGLAYHFEAKKIAMIGVDGYGYGHWYNKLDPYSSGWKDKEGDYLARIPPIYASSVKQFKKRKTEVVLGSPDSPIDCFDKMSPEEAIKWLK